ncbi:hypothetical protein lerEdw1_009642 [Lerista edwardsae]|nr:hypothetical protein lerEdw1_009642 [Lerista edwardsae]
MQGKPRSCQVASLLVGQSLFWSRLAPFGFAAPLLRALAPQASSSPAEEEPGHKSASLDLKSKEDKDAELDKRIEALRRKNQALIKRYQAGGEGGEACLPSCRGARS